MPLHVTGGSDQFFDARERFDHINETTPNDNSVQPRRTKQMTAPTKPTLLAYSDQNSSHKQQHGLIDNIVHRRLVGLDILDAHENDIQVAEPNMALAEENRGATSTSTTAATSAASKAAPTSQKKNRKRQKKFIWCWPRVGAQT